MAVLDFSPGAFGGCYPAGLRSFANVFVQWEMFNSPFAYCGGSIRLIHGSSDLGD
jgi:hypothetical protein